MQPASSSASGDTGRFPEGSFATPGNVQYTEKSELQDDIMWGNGPIPARGSCVVFSLGKYYFLPKNFISMTHASERFLWIQFCWYVCTTEAWGQLHNVNMDTTELSCMRVIVLFNCGKRVDVWMTPPRPPARAQFGRLVDRKSSIEQQWKSRTSPAWVTS